MVIWLYNPQTGESKPPFSAYFRTLICYQLYYLELSFQIKQVIKLNCAAMREIAIAIRDIRHVVRKEQ